MAEDLYPIDDVSGQTYLIDPNTIVKMVPYGLKTMIYTYEVFGSITGHEVTRYVVKTAMTNLIIDFTDLHLIRYNIGSYINVSHIISSNGVIVKHTAGIDVVSKIYKNRLKTLGKEEDTIPTGEFGPIKARLNCSPVDRIIRDDARVRRMLP